MRPLFEIDIPNLLSKIGFENININAFREAENIDPENCTFWRFPWTRISMSKPK